ncbi:uncharacterized protein HMPREF1541_09486 [Cyphellophora europaea CBS 101466]|uniref:Inositol-1-monophosphatase n=1 Tax=Cyphellophora europaea (strain CBS 101466) TaxID=1220924 RepID=W2SCJ5_CYPE1|nr:uncharacterized protein HMPREF1541_09486 [Cyphellophora europaea CBS 101466]ETN45654.1 hypothetical protein HMPREF1541_09486 [Cyphellophora europaea CBS 101466]
MSSSADSISDGELEDIYRFAIQLGRDAGQMLLDGLQRRRSLGAEGMPEAQVEKLNAVDIVTQTDHDVEAFIHKSIRERYPTHEFVGEETYSAGATRDYLVTDRPTWIVDPLDGTVNYTHGFPMFCVSIALCVDQRPVVGVIYAPLLQQLFSARRGGGAWLNESTSLPLLGGGIGPLPREAPRKCLFGCEWGKDRRDPETGEGNLGRKIESFVTMAMEPRGKGERGGMVHGVRSLGSATMDLAYTAMGAFDIWWEGGCWEWDVAAGICLLQEAGGLVTTANPPVNWEERWGPGQGVPEISLGGRLYLCIRPAVDAVDGSETGRQSQERVVREVWKRVKRLDYSRPGVEVS